MDASSRRIRARQNLAVIRRPPAYTLALVRQDLRTSEERRVILPLLRRLKKAEWHLGRGMRQGRTDLKTSAELHLAVREFESVKLDLPHVKSGELDSAHLAEALKRVQALADKGATEAWLAQARLHLKQGSARAANNLLIRILKVDSQNRQALILKGRVEKIIRKPRS